jgi:5'-nucleotidase
VKWIVSASLCACVAVAAGCNANKKTSPTASAIPPLNAAVLNVPAAPSAQYTPPAVKQPVVYDSAQPIAAAPQVAPAPAPAPAALFKPQAQAQPASEMALADYSEPAAAPTIHRATPMIRRSAPAITHTAPAHHTRAKSLASSAHGAKYKIKKGDSLWSIAQSRYGNGNRWKTIARANPKINPNHILAGTTIVLP